MTDPFADIEEATRRHRDEHGCDCYVFSGGSLLGVISAAAKARRIVEVGTALGYTAMWLAHGSPGAHVDTIEVDEQHVHLAHANLAAKGLDNRVQVHQGSAEDLVPLLQPDIYDVAFFDGAVPEPVVIEGLSRLLRRGGVLVAGSLNLTPDDSVATLLADDSRWLAHLLGDTALAVKL